MVRVCVLWREVDIVDGVEGARPGSGGVRLLVVRQCGGAMLFHRFVAVVAM